VFNTQAKSPLRRIVGRDRYDVETRDGIFSIPVEVLECGHIYAVTGEERAIYRRRCWKCRRDAPPRTLSDFTESSDAPY